MHGLSIASDAVSKSWSQDLVSSLSEPNLCFILKCALLVKSTWQLAAAGGPGMYELEPRAFVYVTCDKPTNVAAVHPWIIHGVSDNPWFMSWSICG